MLRPPPESPFSSELLARYSSNYVVPDWLKAGGGEPNLAESVVKGSDEMALSPGARLRSAVCTTEVVIVKTSGREVDLRCGGVPMLDMASVPEDAEGPRDGFADGTMLGKRYAHEASAIEILCTKPGSGSLSVGDEVLRTQQAKPLPSSD
jgi:hypothetical protein